MSVVNQYSFLIMAAVFLAALAVFAFRRGLKPGDLTALAALALGFLLAYLLLHPTASSDETEAQIRSRIGAGTPVLLELQSPFCIACMAARPVVDAIEREQAGRLQVIRLNVQDPSGRALAAAYAAQYTPTFVLFDADGAEVWRTVGAVDPESLRRSLAQP